MGHNSPHHSPARTQRVFFRPENAIPWTAKDARRHTKAAKSPHSKRQWSTVANRILQDTGDEGRAVRGANAAVSHYRSKYGLESRS